MALSVTLIKTPYTVSFSGNPLPFVFILTPYGATEKAQDIRLQVMVYVEKGFGTNVFVQAYNQNYYPDGYGQFSLDLHTVIDPYLTWYTPKPGLKKIVEAAGQRARYKISYLLQQQGAAVGTSTDSDIFYAIKGGLAYEQWHPSEFFTEKVLTDLSPLSFAAAGEKVFLDQPLFLWYTYPYDAGTYSQSVIFTFYLDNGTTVTYTLTSSLYFSMWGVYCVPVGFAQIDTGSIIPAGRTIVSYNVNVASGIISYAVANYVIDQRRWYNTFDILYRNSLGGIDSVRLRGQVDFEADYQLQNATRTTPPAYYSNQNLLPQAIQENNYETVKYTGDTGFIPLELVNKLRDVFISPQVMEVYNGKYVPVVTLNKTVKFYANRDSLLSVQLQWQRAFANAFFTPATFMPETRSCPAVDNLQVVQLSKNILRIMYSLAVPYDQVQVQIISTGSTETYQYTGNNGSVDQSFVNPATTDPVTITVRARTVCDGDSDPVSYGPFTTLSVTVHGNIAPVANDDFYNIDAGFTALVALTGSVLSNDYSPDGNALTAVPSGGATTYGGAYTLDSAGNVHYLPPSTGYRGIDTFNYTVSDGINTATATVHISVGLASSVFVFVRFQNVIITDGPNVNGEVWLNFYSDPTGSMPVDVTSAGLEISVTKTNTTQDQYGTIRTGTTTTIYNVYGTAYRIFSGAISTTYHIFGATYPSTSNNSFRVNAGSGYMVG